MHINTRIFVFVQLGKEISKYLAQNKEDKEWEDVIRLASIKNQWFTKENILHALKGIEVMLQENELLKWINSYPISTEYTNKKVGVIMAGNIPLVGFHDFLCVLLAGHHVYVKLSSDDDVLLSFLAKKMVEIEPEINQRITFFDKSMDLNVDAVIATGSNNTARYFEYYFSKYPHIIRKNRSTVAVLNGKESENEMELLADDIFYYFGLGCRNVSKVFVPKGFDIDKIYQAVFKYKDIINNNKYIQNYNYYRTIYLMSLVKFFDNGFLLIKEDEKMASPVSNLFLEYYENLEEVNKKLNNHQSEIQVVATNITHIHFDRKTPLGQTQQPRLSDYADGVDTMNFLTQIK
jgi:hypothetical protein